jgi:hypothetical protein
METWVSLLTRLLVCGYRQRIGGKPRIVPTVNFGKIEDLAAATQGARQPPHPRQTVVAALWRVAERLAHAQFYPAVPAGRRAQRPPALLTCLPHAGAASRIQRVI